MDVVRAVLCGLALMVPIVSLLVLVSQTLRVPIFGMVVLWMAFSHLLLGDNHDVRTLEDAADERAVRSAAGGPGCVRGGRREARQDGRAVPSDDR